MIIHWLVVSCSDYGISIVCLNPWKVHIFQSVSFNSIVKMVLIIKYSSVATIEMEEHRTNHRNCILGVELAFFTNFNFLSPF